MIDYLEGLVRYCSCLVRRPPQLQQLSLAVSITANLPQAAVGYITVLWSVI